MEKKLGTMYHHGNGTYGDAHKKAVQVAEMKLQDLIAAGQEKQQSVMSQLDHEIQKRQDFLVPRERLGFTANPEVEAEEAVRRLKIDLNEGGECEMTDFAFGQLCEKLRIPSRYAKSLLEYDPNLAAKHFRDIRNRASGERFMIREVEGRVKGILSDRYKTIDQYSVVERFMQNCQANNSIPMDAMLTDRRFVLRSCIPEVLYPLPTEPLVIGMQVSSSDYGDGALSLKIYHVRMWCTNLCIGEEAFREVHMGGRLDDGDGLVKYSNKTLNLNSQTALSAMGDAMKAVLSLENRDRLLNIYKEAAEDTVDVDNKLLRLRNNAILNKAQADQVADLIKSEERIEVLPQTKENNSRLRFAQALGWVAHGIEGEQKLLVEAQAGKELGMVN